MKRFSSNTIICTAIVALVLCGFFSLAGCRKKPLPNESKGLSTQQSESQWNEQLLDYAVKNLQRLDEFQGGEMRQQVIDRLNQWIRLKKIPEDWRPDPMIETLPPDLQKTPPIENLGKLEFSKNDGLALQEDVWMRDVSNWARGRKLEDLSRAKRLFDWTVRNIQIEAETPDPEKALPQQPWETLLFGRGTADDRAWVFALLCRQQGIQAMLLALPGENKVWAVGVLDQGKIYLFDAKLGLPIPAADGVKFDGDRLDVEPATLAAAAADDGILRQLDVDEKTPYPVKAEQLKGVVGLVVASPASLSARMAMFEEKLSGDERVVLTVDPGAIAKLFKDAGGLAEIRLWQRPFQVASARDNLTDPQRAEIDQLMKPFTVGGELPLWAGRTLYLKGVFTGDDSATSYLQKARPSKQKLLSLRSTLSNIPETADRAHWYTDAFGVAKQDATYWLGLIASLGDDTRSAVDYLFNRTLEEYPDGRWINGAKYNLAITYESAGEFKKAVDWLRADEESPAHTGNLIRAKWLEKELTARDEQAKQKQKATEPKLPGLP